MINSLYEPFIRWSMVGSVYVYSDPHFDDRDCLYMNPAWPSPEEQIKRINQKVYKNDTLIILGDVGNEKYIKQLKAGHKVLILGNHDKGRSNYTFDNLFDEVYGGPLFVGEKILLSHEPIPLPFAVNIHGHCHNGVFKESEKDYNVASDVINWAPVNLGKMIKEGLLSDVDSIHRITIDNVIERKRRILEEEKKDIVSD